MSSNELQSPNLKKHAVRFSTVFFMIFCMCAAGPYGIEDMIPVAGPGLTLAFLVIFPFFWSIPLGLFASELGSAIPDEGGYYKWVQQGLGEFWGFQAGWWRTLSIYVDSAVYPVLAGAYLASILPLTNVESYLVKAFFVLIFTYINLRGIKEVGAVTTALTVFILVMFSIVTVIGIAHWNHNPFTPFTPPGQSLTSSIGLAITIGLWMYAGYESMSTMAGELENPQIIPKATIVSIPVIIASYFLPTMAGLASVGQWQNWATDGGISYSAMAALSGWPVLTVIFVFVAMSANLSMFNAYLASGSRGFFVLADDNLAPNFLKKVGKRYGTPYIAILLMAIIDLVLIVLDFSALIVIDVFLLMFSYILIYIAGIALRIKEPNLARPFKIPLGTRGIIAISVPPIILAIAALFTNGADYLFWGLISAISGPIAYYFCRRRYGGLEKTNPKSKLAVGDIMRACFSFLLFTALDIMGYAYLKLTGESGFFCDWLLRLIPVFAIITVILFLVAKKYEKVDSNISAN